MKTKILLNILLFVALATPGWAASKSASVRVSCTIKPVIALSTAVTPKTAVQAESNLGNQYQMTEDIRVQGGQKTRLYSLTAL